MLSFGVCLLFVAGLTPRIACSSEPITIAGLPLGQPFTMPQCRKDKFGVPQSKPGGCWTFKFPTLKDTEIRDVWWLSGEGPPIGIWMMAYVHGGILDAVAFETAGVRDQDRVMSSLREKFGKPTASEIEDMQNAFGMKFQKIKAVWNGNDVYVDFDGVNDRFDKGFVLIQTAAARAKDAEKREQYERAHPPSKL